MNDQFDLGGIPESDEIIDGDDLRITVPVCEDGECIAEIFLQCFHASPTESIGLVLVKFDEHVNNVWFYAL